MVSKASRKFDLKMKQLLSRIQRRIIKMQLARSNPQSLLVMGEKRLLAAFKRGAKHSAAYKTLLAEAGVEISDIRTPRDVLDRAPVLTKGNTFHRFNVQQLLSAHLATREIASFLTSSGQGGTGFALGVSTRTQARKAASLIDLGLELAFDIDKHHTLMVNCLPMGVTFASEAVCVANVSVREDMACAVIQQTGKLFDQIILCGDPLFLKRLCDYSQDIGLDWHQHRVHVVIGEETFSETFRDYLAQVLGIDPDDSASGLIGSSMGMGELGLNLFNETRETVALRRACIRHPKLLNQLTGIDLAVSPAPTFLVYNPLRILVEAAATDDHGVGDLLVSVLDSQQAIPLIRYATGDRIQCIRPEALRQIGQDFPESGLATMRWPNLPIIALHGRAKDYLPTSGHVDLFKTALYQNPVLAREVSGAHRISAQAEEIHWEVQAGKDRSLSADQARQIVQHLQERLTPGFHGQMLKVELLTYHDFTHGKTIDYERKFAYFTPSNKPLNETRNALAD